MNAVQLKEDTTKRQSSDGTLSCLNVWNKSPTRNESLLRDYLIVGSRLSRLRRTKVMKKKRKNQYFNDRKDQIELIKQ